MTVIWKNKNKAIGELKDLKSDNDIITFYVTESISRTMICYDIIVIVQVQCDGKSIEYDNFMTSFR